MRRATWPAALLLVAALAGCGGGSTGPTPVPTPTPTPTPAPISGAYQLTIDQSKDCNLPGLPAHFDVDARSGGTTSQPELIANLPGGNTNLELDLLYETPLTVHGGLGTTSPQAIGDGHYTFIRAVLTGTLTRDPSGRSQVTGGLLVGDISIGQAQDDPRSLGTCTSKSSSWELTPR